MSAAADLTTGSGNPPDITITTDQAGLFTIPADQVPALIEELEAALAAICDACKGSGEKRGPGYTCSACGGTGREGGA